MSGFSMIFVALCSTLLLQSNLYSAQIYDSHFCLGGNYTANSSFEDHLSILLSSITVNITPNSYMFFTKTAGNETGNRVYALFQCRGDYASDDCKGFAIAATNAIKTKCPRKKEAIILYDECWLHYSNRSLSALQFEPTALLYTVNSVGDPSVVTPKFRMLMERLVVEAVSVSANSFAIGKDVISSSQEGYGLVQCVQNLPKTDCKTCLTRAVSKFSVFTDNNTSGGLIFMPSCIAIFADYEFYLNPAPVLPLPPPPPPPLPSPGQEKNSSQNVVIIVVPAVIVVVLLSMIPIFIHLRRKKGYKMAKDEDVGQLSPVQSLQLDFSTVGSAAGNFCDANKLGEGGFGSVYKGKLPDGRDIAVKRLSRGSVQGGDEFKNEVVLLSKLEHRNLVKLLGFCLEGDEKLLIYEFVPNGSLDQYLFDPGNVPGLDWERRYKIIRGIASGLLYLHEESSYMIIHRDIKASNILLDEKMNPKISDFGMARLFMVDQTQGSTKRIVGTLGYMAPEYVYHGHFSVKSDVFSFGVLLLEIISGRKNNRYYESQCEGYLLSCAWKHLLDGTSLEFLDPSLGNSYSETEVIRCIHLGLLCVQEDVAKRPTMASIVVKLNRNTITLPLPSAPAFFLNSTAGSDMISEEHVTDKTYSSHQSTGSSIHTSINEVSITELCPR